MSCCCTCPTCEEKKQISIETAEKNIRRLTSGDDPYMLVKAFFSPDHAIDKERLRRQVAEFLFNRTPMNYGDNAGLEYDPDCPCICSVTGCDTDNECPSWIIGWHYAALARAAEHAVSLAYVPFAFDPYDLAPGESIIWDDNAVPLNRIGDPCVTFKRGAFVKSGIGVIHDPLGVFLEFNAVTTDTPVGGPIGTAKVYSRIVSGKTQLVVKFPTGAVQVLATEP